MKTQIMKGASVLTAILFFSMLMAPVLAAPTLPFTRLGDTTHNSVAVYSWIDGVQYGTATTSGTGWLEIDTVGDETDQNEEKTGGNVGDTIFYTLSQLTGATGQFFADTDVYSVGGENNETLGTAAAAIPLLKIDVLASQSTVTGLPDYVIIYNPHSAAVNAGLYSLAVGTAGALPIVAGDIPTGLSTNNVINIPIAGSLVIDMTKWGGLAAGGNAVKLIYTTGSLVVDRVEYGSIATAPENTIMPDAAAPASAQEIYRNGHADTNDCAVDFLTRAQSVVRDLVAPTVNAGADMTIRVATAKADATATDPAPSSGIATIAWTSVPAGAIFTPANALATTVSASAEGTYVCTLTVTDNAGNVGTDTFTLIWDTSAPIVNAGADMTIRVATAKADATADGAISGIATIAWTSVPAGAIFTPANALATTVSASAEGTYVCTLTVTDNAGNIGTDTFTLIWDVSAPIVDAGANLGTISVATAKNDATADGAIAGIASIVWSGAGITFVPANALSTTVSAVTDGLYTATLTVTDNAGNVGTDTFTFTWLNPVAAATATGPTSAWTNVNAITIAYTMINAPTSVALYYTTNTAAPYTWIAIGNDPSLDGLYDWVVPADGQYSWLAVGNGEAGPDVNTVPEAGTYNYDGSVPIVEAGADMAAVGAKNDATADGSISGIATILWTSAPAGVTFTPNNALATSVDAAVGVYTCTLTVTDNAGNIGTDFFTLTVSGGAGATPDFVWANKTGGVVRLEWSGGTAPYDIFVSNQVNGGGFNFGTPTVAGVTDHFYTFSVLGDGNSYSYIVRGQGDATNSNIAWKYAFAIQKPLAPNVNWVSIPYSYQYTTLGQIGPDVGNARTTQIRVWSVASQTYKTIAYNALFGWTGDTAYVLQPGDSLMIFCANAGTWDIVGSHNDMALNIQKPLAPNINWFSLPFHHSYSTLGQLGPSVGNTRTTQIRVWSTATQTYKTIAYNALFGWTGDTTYALMPGDAVMIFCTNAGTWTPSVNTIGA